MKPPETNHGGHIDTQGHSVFYILPPDVEPPEQPPEETNWFDSFIGCVEFAVVTLAIFCAGGLVAGILFQLFTKWITK